MTNLINVERATVGYGTRTLLDAVSLGVDEGDAIGVVGRNGDGKTTLLGVLTGAREPDSGRITHTSGLSVGYLRQGDELSGATVRDVIVGGRPDHVWAAEPDTREVVEHLLSAVDLDTAVGGLSGGERRRVALAQVLLAGHDVLVLDEPTNHLDVDAREALVHALNEFAGAVVLISHDRHLIETCADRLWIAGERTIKPYDGDLDSYAELVLQRARLERQARAAPTLRSAEATPRSDRPSRVNPGQLRRRIADAESTMNALRDKISVLDRALEDPSIYRQEPRKAADFAQLRNRLAADLEAVEELWLELQTTIDALGTARDG